MAIADGRNDEDDDPDAGYVTPAGVAALQVGNDEIGSAQAAGRNDEAPEMVPDGLAKNELAALAVDGNGKPLAPLAEAGGRGCSVCGRTGHRKGGKACLGDADPARKIVAGVATPAHTHGVDGWTRNPLTGHWECGTEGCDVSAAEPVAEQLTAEQAEPTMTTADGPGQTVPVPDADNEPDPFDEDEPSAEQADKAMFLGRLNNAKDKAEIRQIRSEATELGVWDDQLLQAGLARIKAL
jgi:hypothetical protein